jgi:hypothetical protein
VTHPHLTEALARTHRQQREREAATDRLLHAEATPPDRHLLLFLADSLIAVGSRLREHYVPAPASQSLTAPFASAEGVAPAVPAWLQSAQPAFQLIYVNGAEAVSVTHWRLAPGVFALADQRTLLYVAQHGA